jgi:tRNA(Ile)-lysidine synthetase-like protein
MPKYVIAVSGGVDSVVLLDMMSKLPEPHLVVAHFDHGIRDDSQEDAAFVGTLAKKYGLEFETKREELGKQASEERARQRRYSFLNEMAEKYKAAVVTAHHSDDIIETIAINHSRGTGWRGLAVLDSSVIRPLLTMSKQHIYDYAMKHGLEWREDSTNSSDAYLRNRLRSRTKQLSSDIKQQLLNLRRRQVALKKDIDQEVKQLVGTGPEYERHFFIQAHVQPAQEVLRHITMGLLTRPQLERTLLAIKTTKGRKIYQAGNGVEFHFTPRHFELKLIK